MDPWRSDTGKARTVGGGMARRVGDVFMGGKRGS